MLNNIANIRYSHIIELEENKEDVSIDRYLSVPYNTSNICGINIRACKDKRFIPNSPNIYIHQYEDVYYWIDSLLMRIDIAYRMHVEDMLYKSEIKAARIEVIRNIRDKLYGRNLKDMLGVYGDTVFNTIYIYISTLTSHYSILNTSCIFKSIDTFIERITNKTLEEHIKEDIYNNTYINEVIYNRNILLSDSIINNPNIYVFGTDLELHPMYFVPEYYMTDELTPFLYHKYIKYIIHSHINPIDEYFNNIGQYKPSNISDYIQHQTLNLYISSVEYNMDYYIYLYVPYISSLNTLYKIKGVEYINKEDNEIREVKSKNPGVQQSTMSILRRARYLSTKIHNSYPRPIHNKRLRESLKQYFNNLKENKQS